MARALLSCALLAACALCACRAKSSGPEADGQSHWLHACTRSDECGDALCLCGVCSRSCDADGACGSGTAAKCVARAALPSTCQSGASMELGLCMAQCDQSASCASLGAGLSCVAGTCVAAATAPTQGPAKAPGL